MFRFRTGTIRDRLLMSYVLVTLVTAIAIGAGTVLVSYYAVRQQAVERLESVAARKTATIQAWIQSLEQELIIAANTEGEFERINVVLDLAQENRYYEFYNKAVRNRLSGFVRQSTLLTDALLVNPLGLVVLSTNPAEEGTSLAGEPFFLQALSGAHARLPFPLASDPPGTREPVLVGIPLVNADGNTLGVMAARADPGTLFAALADATGLGKTGATFLMNGAGSQLRGSAPTLDPAFAAGSQSFLTSGAEAALAEQATRSGLYRNDRGARVIGVYRWLPELEALLATEQDLADAFRSVSLTIWINVGIAFLAILFAAVVSILMARSIAGPLGDLVGTATQIAGGDLTQTAQARGADEIGILARAFNSMTAQLRDLIGTLEKRVADRTNDLHQRAQQLETSVRVSREITSIQSIDTLMAQVVNLIREGFGYYRVHVFLFDQGANELVLRARSGSADLDYTRLEVDQRSLNTRALQTGSSQLVNDVAADPYYLADAGLPETRAELVVPLRLGDQMIGTLDVYSTEVDAFSPEDVRVIQSLGDQIAIAIENARLYDRSRELAVIEERTRLARELHDSVTQSLYSVMLLTEGWRRMAGTGSKIYVEDYLARITEITGQALREMRLLIHELRPPILERDGLVEALRRRLDAVERRAGVEARLVMDDLMELPPRVEVELYRVAQEALNNALKHAAATEVTVRMCVDDGEVVLEVVDNGRGFDPDTAVSGGGMGLESMQERARRVNGSLTITSSPGQGSTVCIRVPVTSGEPVAAVV